MIIQYYSTFYKLAISTVMSTTKKSKIIPEKQPQEQEYQSSQLSDEDDDANLLTTKVQQKLLSTMARIKMKDPSIYNTTQPLYEQSDFSSDEEESEHNKKDKGKFTYKDMIKQKEESQQQQNEIVPPVLEEKRAKESFKNALAKNIKIIGEEKGELFTVKQKLVKKKQVQQPQDEKSKFKDLTKNFDKQSKKLIKKVWKSDLLDQTDLFLKDYILDKKWLSSKYKAKEDEEKNQKANEEEKMIDEEDQERSQQMDQYEAEYNFRFEEPGGTNITQYPRQIRQSLRQKPETRKQKRKKALEKKKQQQLQIRKQAEENQQKLKKSILQRLAPEQQEDDHDWFFCDDCCKGMHSGQQVWQCQECEDYILCKDCNEIIIHKHPLKKGVIPEGYDAPQACEDVLHQLKSCKICRRRIPPTKKRYQFTDRSYIVNAMCEECFDDSKLQIKKKYKQIQPQQHNYEQLLEQDPEKIKQLTNIKEIQDMVDEYIKNDFEGVISGGVKTKFKYINVPAQGFGLSDEQILFGDDKELNKYISIKNLAPYKEERLRLRNSIFNKRIKTIKKSVKTTKKLLEKGVAKFNRTRTLNKLKLRAKAVKMRRQKKLKILNLSNKQTQRNHFVSNSRLLSYGIRNEQEDQ